MAANKIDAQLLSRMFLAGAQNLDAKKEWINELNVFPVPDGDTGTNMTMTIMSAAREVQTLEKPSMTDLAKAISGGSLRGARGNSGVILSQLLRGFTKIAGNKSEITIPILAEASEKAVETAYKAVMKPKEGTILTVARGMADKARELCGKESSMEAYIKKVIAYGQQVLDKTPEMLPVLKEAGVVDSGGQGLMVVLEGALDAFLGKEIRMNIPNPSVKKNVPAAQISEEDIKFGYCTEYIVNIDKPLSEEQTEEYRKFLTSIGDSIVLVAVDDLIKVHVHTNDPGIAIQKGLSYGWLTNMKIDNMRFEHREAVIQNSAKEAQEQKEASAHLVTKPVGHIAVAAGDGFKEIFTGLNVDQVISGGQTMNPSTEDLLNAIDQVHAHTIFLYPNNKNIILAANQAKELVQEKNIIVIPTRTVPQGISAVINYMDGMSVEENQQQMNEAIGNVKTCEITYAIRDTSIDEKEIHQGDIMSVGDHGILAVGQDICKVACDSVDLLADDSTELISIYYGQEYSEEKANEIADIISEKYPDCDVEISDGGQPVYYCIISVE